MDSTRISKRMHRHKRARAKIFGTATRPRISVFRSNRRLWLQLVDDVAGRTLIAADSGVSAEKRGGEKPMERAQKAGIHIAEKAREKKITRAVFDRGGYAYHGLVKAVAEGARKGGLKI